MKTHTLPRFLAATLITGIGLLPAPPAAAQTFTNLYNFGISGGSTDGDLILSGNTFYGTAEFGSSNGYYYGGTVFAITTNGTGFVCLHGFSEPVSDTNSDGCQPYAGLILSGSTLYGTAKGGGNAGNGAIFAINTNGSGFTNLHSFTATLPVNNGYGSNSDGAMPYAGLVLSGNTLYGTASSGGTSRNGTIFAINTDGTGFTNLYSFRGLNDNDGANPYGGLILSGNMLYGTASYGGSGGNGTVFAINTNGTGYTNLYSFTAGGINRASVLTNSDGAGPQAGLILSGNTLYGTANLGGLSGNGSVFAINTDGTGFTNLHGFKAGGILSIAGMDVLTNSDGANPQAGLVLLGNTLYGTAWLGGPAGNGTIFAINTNGTDFAILHSFTPDNGNGMPNTDGANPYAGLILSGNILYGATTEGGSGQDGTLFALTLPVPPCLGIAQAGNNVVISWPISTANCVLQTASNLSAGSWSNVTCGVATVGTNYLCTNAVTGQAAFFRLQQQ